MDLFIFNILALVLFLNALVLPLGTLGEFIYSFVTRSEMTDYTGQWQAFKYDWWEEACDVGDELGRWLVCDIFIAFVILFFCALLGSAGLLTLVVGIPVGLAAIAFGFRYVLDSMRD